MPEKKRLLRLLPPLALAFALAGPLAALELEPFQVTPAEPSSDDPVKITVTGVSPTSCFAFEGVQRFRQNIDFVFSACPLLPPREDTPFTFSREIGPLPAGTYHVRTLLNGSVRTEVDLEVFPAAGPCTPDATALCLTGRRFRAATSWTANGEQGDGQTLRLTGETGAFSFFQPDNVEVVVKVIDGCAIDGRFWVFATGLTNVGTVLTVTDTATGAFRTYQNPAGTPFAPIQDTAAFPCP
jgi:hypothetical protein